MKNREIYQMFVFGALLFPFVLLAGAMLRIPFAPVFALFLTVMLTPTITPYIIHITDRFGVSDSLVHGMIETKIASKQTPSDIASFTGDTMAFFKAWHNYRIARETASVFHSGAWLAWRKRWDAILSQLANEWLYTNGNTSPSRAEINRVREIIARNMYRAYVERNGANVYLQNDINDALLSW